MLVLSLFPGIDLLGRGFEAEGYCVVRGPDLIWGQNIVDFHIPAKTFQGIIAGSPCQDFSRARKRYRVPPSGHGERMLAEFRRLVTEGKPEWFLLENVDTVPDLGTIEGYHIQRFNLNANECGVPQNRLRSFQFGHDLGFVIQPARKTAAGSQACCMAREGEKADRREWKEFCRLQGLPDTFDLPGWSTKFKYRAVGNGVPVPMGRIIAEAISKAAPMGNNKLCICGCGRVCGGNRTMETATCRKTMQIRRERIASTRDGSITPIAW